MKIFIIKASIIIIVIISALNARAQNDYVITIKGDSIACKISTSLTGAFRYKSAAMSGSEKITPDVIKEYYIAGKDMLSRAVFEDSSKKAVFMTVLEQGKISLYAMSYTNYSTMPNYGTVGTTGYGTTTYKTTDWFVSKGSDNVIAMKTNDWSMLKGRQQRKDIFASMLKDNETVYNKFIVDGKFSNDQIRNLIHLYNTGHPMELYSDYVITKNKDTILCEIEPATFDTPARYKANPKDRFTKIDNAITGYFLVKDSSSYLLEILPKEKRPNFVKCLVKGRINLYTYSEHPIKDNDASLYASNGTGELVQIKHSFTGHFDKDEKKALIDLFSDDPNLSGKIENLPHDFSAIVNFIKIYNVDYLNTNKEAK
jgi:hypothetical protein